MSIGKFRNNYGKLKLYCSVPRNEISLGHGLSWKSHLRWCRVRNMRSHIKLVFKILQLQKSHLDMPKKNLNRFGVRLLKQFILKPRQIDFTFQSNFCNFEKLALIKLYGALKVMPPPKQLLIDPPTPGCLKVIHPTLIEYFLNIFGSILSPPPPPRLVGI